MKKQSSNFSINSEKNQASSISENLMMNDTFKVSSYYKNDFDYEDDPSFFSRNKSRASVSRTKSKVSTSVAELWRRQSETPPTRNTD